MSYVPIVTSTAATAAALAAAEAARREEEDMTRYNAEEIEDWEFKIVRSAMGKFKSPQFVQQLCDEEAKAGWIMLEKFDEYRIRFKRKVDERANDRHRPIDPYRTTIGITNGKLGLTIAGSVLLGVGVLLFVIFMIKG